MLNMTFDFSHIIDRADFYQQFVAQSHLSMPFGANLDALWDALTGGIILPAHITLKHLAYHPHRDVFSAIVEVLVEAECALQGELILEQN